MVISACSAGVSAVRAGWRGLLTRPFHGGNRGSNPLGRAIAFRSPAPAEHDQPAQTDTNKRKRSGQRRRIDGDVGDDKSFVLLIEVAAHCSPEIFKSDIKAGRNGDRKLVTVAVIRRDVDVLSVRDRVQRRVGIPDVAGVLGGHLIEKYNSVSGVDIAENKSVPDMRELIVQSGNSGGNAVHCHAEHFNEMSGRAGKKRDDIAVGTCGESVGRRIFDMLSVGPGRRIRNKSAGLRA
jgi:hypothetical protein